ncbi:hypothetical protein AAFP30_28280 [Gordonia sp. CPCC 205515]|uniref:hypothetical protein n=1 Tax=Gordonia sp. CPCC 205515 TaxID=3140791 RepID=UPI003AF35A51
MSHSSRRKPLLTGVTSAALVASIAMGAGAGLAQAAPEQGGTNPNDTAPQQGGTSPDSEAPPVLEQGGTTPTPEPAPVEPAYNYNPGPGTLPSPPQEAPYQPYVEQSTYSGNSGPSYETTYTPIPEAPLTAPKPTAPVRPIAPPPEKIRVGNYITDIPKGMSKRDVTSINEWAAYGEAKIAQNLIAVGVPKDEASRRAAATIIGVALGGTTGAAVGSSAALLGVVPGAVVGTGVGAIAGGIYNAVTFSASALAGPEVYGPIIGLGAAAGAGIGLVGGAAAGAAAAGAAGAATGAVIGGTIGGVTAYTLGAGDPGAHPVEPWKQGDKPGTPKAPEAKPLPNPKANQFELHLPAEKAAQAGLPRVDYVVNQRGDVNVQVGTAQTGWSAEQANAPYQAMGANGSAQKENAKRYTKQNAPQIKQVLPGVNISWPQEIAPAAR